MTLQSLFSSDKSPLIVAVALTIFGWYVNSISNYFSEETIIYLTVSNKTPDTDEYIIKNISLTKNLENASIQINCVPSSECLLNADMELIAPFAMVGNQKCYGNNTTYQAQISLQPGASIRINAQKKPGTKTAIFFGGRYRKTCNDNDLELAQVRIEQSPSLIAFLLENFILYYFVSIIVLIIVFVLTVRRLTFTTTDEGEKDVAQTLNVHLTLNDDTTRDAS